MDRNHAYNRTARIATEFNSARHCVSYVLRLVQENELSAHAIPEATLGSLKNCFYHLEATYIVRLFAEFEGILRDYWQTLRNTEPIVSIMIDRIGDRRVMTPGILGEAHSVRDVRNSIVHEAVETVALTFEECRSRLSRFMSYLPKQW